VCQQRMVADAVQNHIVAFSSLREILLRVINYAICADGADHLRIPGTANACHIGAKRPGNLYGERTHAASCSVDQNLLTRLNLPMISKSLQCGKSRNGNSSRLVKRRIGWLQADLRHGSTRVLRKGSTTCAKHLVAWLELSYILACRLHLTSHIRADPWVLWLEQPGHDANQVGRSLEQSVNRIHRSRVDSYQNLIVPRDRLF